MVGRNINVHMAEAVAGAHQLFFLVGGQIAEVENFEFAEGDERSQGEAVFRSFGGRMEVVACEIGLARSGQGFLNNFTVGGHNFRAHALNGQNIARLGDEVLVFSGGEDVLVGGKKDFG